MDMNITFLRKRSYLFSLVSLLFLMLFLIPSAFASSKEAEEVRPDNGIPVVYLNIDETQGTIEDMNSSPNHSVYCYGTVSIEVPEGFHYLDFPDNPCESLKDMAMSIRGRGNSTWKKSMKKPYKIKLDKKTDVFGLGKNKHWALLANVSDPSFIKDRITGWLGDEMGFEFSPRGVPVDLVMTGQEFGTRYLGSYYFTETVRVDTNRLEIDELIETDTDEPVITGGYLVQNAIQLREGSPDRFFTRRGVEWGTHTPSFDTEEENLLMNGLGDDADSEQTPPLLEEDMILPELGDAYENPVQQQYIQNHIQKVEDVLFSPGTGYRELMDIESAAKYWWVNDFSMNTDGFATGSTYIYKKRDADGVTGKIFWGPLWDFDYAWGYQPYYEDFSPRHEWLNALFCDREAGGFLEEVKNQWPAFKEAIEKLIKDGGVIDQYYEETKASADQDFIMYHTSGTYEEAINDVKTWIRNRLDWAEANLSQLDDLAHSVTFMADGEIYALTYKENNGYNFIYGNEDHPEKEGFVFLGWKDEDGNLIKEKTVVDRDMVLTAAYVDEREATRAEDITFRKTADITGYNRILPEYTIDYCVIPEDAMDKRVDWSSSDENLATVSENGVVTYTGSGEVTITAKLKNGASRTFTLVITREDLPVPESIVPEQEEIRLTVGSQAPVIFWTEPSPAVINSYDYYADDEAIVSVNEYGVLKALSAGETVVHVNTSTDGSGWGQYCKCETSVRVIVSEGTSPDDPSEPDEPDEPTDPDKPEDLYTIISETSLSWVKGGHEGLQIVVRRSEADETCFSHFTSVSVDDKNIRKDKDYTAVSSSTVVTLNPPFLNGLKKGDHTVSILFDDGKAEITLSVSSSGKLGEENNDNEDEDSENDVPAAGDNHSLIWFWLMPVSLIGAGVLMKRKKRG
ncbi:MAG: CotH kinase family protein [Lachnospiraceae bacterium]|nr:CotH kinase family protein [Lachnospiraceae bacterium]